MDHRFVWFTVNCEISYELAVKFNRSLKDCLAIYKLAMKFFRNKLKINTIYFL